MNTIERDIVELEAELKNAIPEEQAEIAEQLAAARAALQAAIEEG